ALRRARKVAHVPAGSIVEGDSGGADRERDVLIDPDQSRSRAVEPVQYGEVAVGRRAGEEPVARALSRPADLQRERRRWHVARGPGREGAGLEAAVAERVA